MVDDSAILPLGPLIFLQPDSIFRFQVLRYVVVAFLTVSLDSTRSPSHVFSANAFVSLMILQVCVWDWLLALSDEYEMIRQGDRRLRYVLYMLYLVAR